MDYPFDISNIYNEQLMITLQDVNEVNRKGSRLAVASSVYDSTKHIGLVTPEFAQI